MKKLFFLLIVSLFFFTLFSLSMHASPDETCCCLNSCGFEFDCVWMGSCTNGYLQCSNYYCSQYCTDSSECVAIDTDGGEDIYTKGVCYWRFCNTNNECEVSSQQADSCIGSNSVYEMLPRTDIPNYCKGKTIYCPSGYECSDGACVEVGAKEGDFCDGKTEKTTCVSGLKCCDECNKCYESCPEESGVPNVFCCAKDNHCPEDTPYCNLATNECQAEEAPCPRSEYDTYDKAAEGQIACGGTLSGCLWKSDDKYYKIEGTDSKEVNVTVKHIDDGCEKNDLYIYGRSRYATIGSSTGRNEIDSWKGEPDNEFIVVKIGGDDTQRNENCQWEMKVKCEDICEDSNQKCTGPFTSIDARLVDVLEGCLYAHYSKVYSVKGTKNMKVEVKVTHSGGKDCEENNDLIIYDTCSKEIARIENQKVETWIGKSMQNDIKLEIRSESENKNCLWKLEINYVSEKCVDTCTAGDGTDCSPFKCVDGVCSNRCDKSCNAECEKDDDCKKSEFCNSNCKCVEGEIKTIKLMKDANLISSPFEKFEVDTDCDLTASIYGGYDSETKRYREVLTSLEEMRGGYGYWVRVKDDCTMTFSGGPPTTEINLKEGLNLIGAIDNTEITVDDIKDDCEIRGSVFRYIGGGKWEPVTILEPGRGYSINVASDCTID